MTQSIETWEDELNRIVSAYPEMKPNDVRFKDFIQSEINKAEDSILEKIGDIMAEFGDKPYTCLQILGEWCEEKEHYLRQHKDL